MNVDLRLLGPLVLHVAGEEVRVPSGRQERTLLHLAVRRGQVMTVDRLTEMLWAADPPDDADNALQYVVSRLRRLLEPGRQRGDPPRILERVGEGYRLRLPAPSIDTARMEAAAASGSSDVALYRQALDEWRGTPFAGYPEDRVLQTEAARLAQVHTTVLQRWADLEIDRGNTDRVIARLEPVLSADGRAALDEGLRRSLMVALYRHGRPTDALAVYDGLKRRLAEEFGLDPRPVLTAVRDAVLRHDGQVLGATASPPAGVPMSRRTTPPPVPVDTFIGRERESTRLQEALRSSRLVTVTGPSGVGKTRLVQELCQPAEHPTGSQSSVVWVELGEITDPELVLPIVAEAAGLRENLRRPAVDVLAEQLGPDHTVLVVDNAEHLADAVAELVAAVLSRQPALQVLVTSQVRLGIRGEQVLALAPLTPPDAADQSWASPAVQLFCDRAAAIDGGFSVDQETVDHVNSIVASVDGLPLAIELAAASARTLGVAELADRVARSVQGLADGGTDRPDRHRTLTTAFEWSLSTLDDRSRDALAQLSVMADFDLDGAAQVADVTDVAVLADLIDCSLLRRGDDGRYRLLPTMRRYVWSSLASEARDDLVQRLVAWVRNLLQEHGSALRGSGQGAAMRVLDAEAGNVQVALSHMLEAGTDLSAVIEILTVANRYWDWRGRFAEALHWNGRALARVAAAGGEPSGPILGWQAFAAAQEGDFKRALATVDGAVESGWIETSTGLPGGLVIRAVLRRRLGDIDGSIVDARAVLDHADDRGSVWGQGWAHDALAHAYAARADADRARDHAERSLAQFQELRDERGVGWALTALADAARADDDPVSAADHAGAAARIAAAMGDARNLAWALEILAWADAAEAGTPYRLIGAAARLRGDPAPSLGQAETVLGRRVGIEVSVATDAIERGWVEAGSADPLQLLADDGGRWPAGRTDVR